VIQLPDLTRPNHAEKAPPTRALLAQLAAALERIAAQDSAPPKTPDNSSKLRSRVQKQNHPEGEARPPCKRPGVGRTSQLNPDRVIDARLSACSNRDAAFPDVSQQVYERIELPPIKPDVMRRAFSVAAKPAVANGSPPRRHLGWSKARLSDSPSRPWWCTCIMPIPSA
jgi:hypothetical protein